jgi:uncharacterized circularly permuted ATP-grasp superfamily protein
MSEISAEAVDYYHERLAAKHLDSTRDCLEEATRRDHLTFGGRPVCTVLRPFFISEERYRFVQEASTQVMSAVSAVGNRLFQDPNLRRELDLSPDEERIVMIDSGYGAPDVSARLDGFLGPEGEFNFVEYNAESPGGLAYGDALGQAFLSMPIMREFTSRYEARAIPTRRRVYEELMGAYHRWGGGGAPNIAIVDWRGVGTYSEFLLMRSEFESHGCRVRIVDPEDLEYRNGRLFVGDFSIDLVYKRVVIGELLSKYGSKHPLIDAVRDRAVCMANGFGVQLLYKKGIFALLSESSDKLPACRTTAQALARLIPWTRKVRETRTSYRDREIDLVPFIAENREQLVLKPNGDYGGRGVALGWECDDAGWGEAIKTALTESYVVQERVPLGREVYPSLVEGELRFDERYFDLDPYVWDGSKVEGCGIRLSRLALLNVTAGGGSAAPMFVIRPKSN